MARKLKVRETSVLMPKALTLYEDDCPVKRIYAHLGITSTTFYRWLKKNGITLRRKCEPNLSPSEDLSYILGVYLGDGNISRMGKYYRLQLFTCDYSFALSFKSALLRIGLFSRVWGPYEQTVKQRPQFCVANFNSQLINFLKQLSFKEMQTLITKFPLGFLRGFYESEGSVRFKGQKRLSGKTYQQTYLSMTNTNPQNIELVLLALKKLGYRGGLYTYMPKQPNRIPYYKIDLLEGSSKIEQLLRDIRPCIKGIEV